MARHGHWGTGSPVRSTPPAGLGTVLPSRRRSGVSPATSGKILVVAVAAGAALPALQTLDTHVADAEAPRTSETSAAAMNLAAAAQRAPAAAASVRHSVAPVTVATASAPRTSTGSDDAEDSASAGDASDVTALLKSMAIERESGPLEFGRPYDAGNDRTLDGQISKALGMMGLPQRLAPGVKKIIMRESTGNADAVNDWDSNASAGTPSKGLMQLIDTTFRNAVLPELAGRGIFDPVANITAGVRTMIANHSISDVLAGGLKNSAGNYVGYGGAALPDDGLGRAGRA